MKKRLLLLTFLFTGTVLFAQSEVLADDYYKRGEFKKALITYQKLFEQKPYSYKYIYKLIDTHQQLEQYDEAQQILLDRLERDACFQELRCVRMSQRVH